ncbi:hypothetical protein ACFL6D_05435, partial [Spirochaetota bacterium]
FIEKNFYDIIEEEKKIEADRAIDLQSLPPYKIVDLFLDFEKEKDWINFFKCLNIEKFLLSTFKTSVFYERYGSAVPDELEGIINEFKSFLIKSIDFMTVEHKIVKTTIEGTSCEIIARSIEEFFPQDYVKKVNPETLQIEVKWLDDRTMRYRRIKESYYTLELVEDHWSIIAKEVAFIPNY